MLDFAVVSRSCLSVNGNPNLRVFCTVFSSCLTLFFASVLCSLTHMFRAGFCVCFVTAFGVWFVLHFTFVLHLVLWVNYISILLRIPFGLCALCGVLVLLFSTWF